jgi:NifB/MoaA-like Fe-S oxidoreductase
MYIKNSNNYIRTLVLQSAQNANILPLTSVCNVQCIFCSHRQNPPSVEAFRTGHRSLREIKETLDFMDANKPVVIGESVTRILEGEPFTHPQIVSVLKLIRERMPAANIRITSNGTLLDKIMIDFLASLGGITINLSLNSADVRMRQILMSDRRAQEAVLAAELLGSAGLEWHGSIVAMPWLTGWTDIEKTVLYMESCGAQTVRIFMPGYTNLAEKQLRFKLSLWSELKNFVLELRSKVNIPVTFEPQMLADLRAEITGVLKTSPAQAAGLRAGDRVLSVNGKEALTRVQVFSNILVASNPQLRVRRTQKSGITSPGNISYEYNAAIDDASEELEVRVFKERGQTSGLVMDYDLHPDMIYDMVDAARKNRASRVLVLTSVLAEQLIKIGVERFFDYPVEVQVLAAANHFFGGSIMSAGLLTVDDFALALREWLKDSGWQPDLILLPGLAFDLKGRDLSGKSYLNLSEEFGIVVVAL